MSEVITSGVPELQGQDFPIEVWSIGTHVMPVEMGTRLHTSLICAAKATDVVRVVVTLEFPQRPRAVEGSG